MESASEQQPTASSRPPPGRPFPKGVSGNPAGRPRITPQERATRATLEKLLEKRLGAALAVLDKAMKSNDLQSALRAAVDVMDRVNGKAVQRVDATITETAPVVQVTPEMLRLAAQRLLAAQATDAQEVPGADR